MRSICEVFVLSEASVQISKEQLVAAIEKECQLSPEEALDAATSKMSKWPWAEVVETDDGYGTSSSRGVMGITGDVCAFEKDIDEATSVVLSVDSQAGFSDLTGRAKGGSGFIVDVEIYITQGDGKLLFIFHHERRVKTEAEAVALANKFKSFIDSHSMVDLASIPKFGPSSMSKVQF